MYVRADDFRPFLILPELLLLGVDFLRLLSVILKVITVRPAVSGTDCYYAKLFQKSHCRVSFKHRRLKSRNIR